MSLGKKTAQGVFWNYISFAGGKFLTFISTIILARLGLGPDQFGEVAIALLAITYLEAIGDLGIAAALIYQRDDVERASQVAFVISIIMGVVLWALATLSAPYVGAYFNEPGSVPMLRVLAFTLLIQSFGNVHMALLTKELEFRRKLWPDLSRNFAKGFGAIGLALAGFGPWSLIWGQVLSAFAATIALWYAQPWTPRLTWDSKLGKQMLSYGLQILGIEILAVFWSTADYVMVGRYLGKTELGLYQTAFRISDLLIINMCIVAGRVLFPSYAKLSHDPAALRRGFLTTLRYISLITLPVSVGLAVIAPFFVSIFFGQRWLLMIPALALLALRAGISTLSFNSGHLFKAIGRPDIVNKEMVFKLTVLLAVVWLTVPYGFVAVAMGQIGVSLFAVLLDMGICMYVLKVGPGPIWQQIRSALVAALAMGAAVWLVVANTPQGYDVLGLVAAILVGAGSYAGLLWLTERKLLVDSIRSVVHLVRPARPTVSES
ncbi:MAG TPA: lipopolysaccharide biosynthesis protein [Herpetosiphonaceae bacterium]